MHLVILISTAFLGALLVYPLGKVSSTARNALALVVASIPVVWLALLYGQTPHIDYYNLNFIQIQLSFRLNALSWFFGIMIAAIGFLSILFSFAYMRGKENLDFYYFAMLLVNAAMLGIVLSGDLISLFVFWEIMSWSTYLVISYKGGKAVSAGLRYMVMSTFGSCAMLLAIASLYAFSQSMEIGAISSAMQHASPGFTLFILLMFVIGFGIKNAILPLHTWLPDAHSEAVSPFSAVLSSILVRMGIFGLLLIMYGIMGTEVLGKLTIGPVSFNYILCWIAALTILIPLFIAILQDDAKRLIAWSSVGHGGYMVLGIALATPLGVAGGLFHTLNYAICVALLFLSVGAVEHRTGGVRDLNKLGGLMQRMPLTFACALIAVLGLIGIPLTNGFVSKWLIYKTLIADRYAFLALVALIGTWSTVLYGYKFIHNIFLGQLPEKYKAIKEVPFSMKLPMVLLATAVIVFGVLPGIPLKVIGEIQGSLGMEAIKTGLFAMPPELGELNMINILAALAVACLSVFVLIRIFRRSKIVSQDNSYAAGAYVPVDKYQYSAKFFDPAYRLLEPYVKDRIDALYCWMVEKLEAFFEAVSRLYTGNVNTYAFYIILFLTAIFVVRLA
ncbi:MAG: hypothetical protein JRF33_14895 [Deltaproteobacteria bacterium]|nr:hypothetical protein [Deltaproteobacteria bacterium]